jgi:flagellar FliJ protein
MPTSEPLLVVLERERSQRDEALLGLREAQGLASRASIQAQQLADYRAEYQQRWSSRFQVEGSIQLLQCYQGFMQRLEQALGQQRLASERAAARLRDARHTLLEHERRVGSIQKLLERRASEQQRHAARREQSLSDEAAQRSHARQRAPARDACGIDSSN